MTRILLLIVIVAFGALTTLALDEHGYFGIIAYHFPSSAGWQVGVDLVIALTLVMVWMVDDARKTGRAVWPYLLTTLTLGSFGPLFYLLLRQRDATPVRDESHGLLGRPG